MTNDSSNAVIAVFADHQAAEMAVKKLASADFNMKTVSVVGKGYHTEETVIGFYNTSDRIQFWGARGAFWGGLWSLFFGGVFLTVPLVGPVFVLGSMAAIAVAAIESALVIGGLSAIGAALYSIGLPKDSVVKYDATIKSDGFLVMVHGSIEDTARAKSILGTANAASIDVHSDLKTSMATEQPLSLAV